MTLMQKITSFFENKTESYIPFHPELLLFCQSLSKNLFTEIDPKQNPDFIALAFWLRKGHLNQLESFFRSKEGFRVPRGVIFHIPPANIDVMLVYSWITSLLLGNENIIRIPGTKNARSDILLKVIFDLVNEKQFASIKAMNLFIEYGHEEDITALISSKADARVIWGGDETILKIRKIPLQPDGIDIAFPDRFSYGAINAKNYLRSDMEQVAINFYNDIYWFDQSGCSSPRLIFWVGDKEEIELASSQFYRLLQETIEKRLFKISLGGSLLKKTFLFSQSLNLPVEKVAQFSNELSVVYLKNAEPSCRLHCGYGMLYHVPITDLNQIASFTTHKDQTLVHEGFSKLELINLAKVLNGKGITRMVPRGQALNFEPVWDGQDLFNALTQVNVIEEGSE